jgi:hypothetical protein
MTPSLLDTTTHKQTNQTQRGLVFIIYGVWYCTWCTRFCDLSLFSLSLCLCLCLCVSISLYLRLSVHLSLLSISLLCLLSLCLSVSLSVSLPRCLAVSLSLDLGRASSKEHSLFDKFVICIKSTVFWIMEIFPVRENRNQ